MSSLSQFKIQPQFKIQHSKFKTLTHHHHPLLQPLSA